MLNSNDNVNILVKALSNSVNIITKKKNQIITSDAQPGKNVIIFHEGIISGMRHGDGLLLGNFTAPRVFGLNFIIKDLQLYFKAHTDVRYEFISSVNAEKIITEKNLWREVSYNLMAINTQFLTYINSMTGLPTLVVITNCLSQLRAEPEIIRTRRTAADYIIEKSGLSRSTVMKTLAQMKSEGKIILSKGLLVEIINLNLP